MEKIALLNTCPFDLQSVKDREFAYNRLDHDGYRWYSKWFGKNGTGGNMAIVEEMNKISDYMTDTFLKKGIEDIDRLFFTGAVEKTSDPTEANLYALGEHCACWIRLINRRKDYNLYLHFYPKV